MEENFIFAGFGGQGVLLAGKILATAFMLEEKNVTWYPCYGAEMRGGTVNCEIVVSNDEVSSVHKSDVDYLIVLNQLSFDRFIGKVKSGGTIIANSSLVKEVKPRSDIKYLFVPMTEIAQKLGETKTANIVSLGALASVCHQVTTDSIYKALEHVLPEHRKNLLPLNLQALKLGFNSLVGV